VEDSDTNYRTAAATRRSSSIQRGSCRESFLTTGSSESYAIIKQELDQTKKELASYQTRLAVLEAEKLVGSPTVSEEGTPRRPSRLYLPESDSTREKTSSSGYTTSSEYKEAENNIHDAVSNGDMDWLVNNLRKTPHSVFIVNQERRTGLHLASMSNSLSITEFLVSHGSVVNAQDAAGQTPMHLCSDSDVMNLLCSSGGSTIIRDNHGYNPLYVHTLHSRDDLVKCLLANGADPTLKDPIESRTALHCAAEVRSYNIIRLLLSVSSEDSFLNAQDKDGNSALHIILGDFTETLNLQSVRNTTKKAQGLLIQKCLMLLLNRGALVNIKNNSGDTPLHYVCSNTNLRSTMVTAPLVQILLDMAANANAMNNEGCTPLMVSAAHGDWEVCELLVAAGGDLNALCSITSGYLLNNRQYRAFSGIQNIASEEQKEDPIHTAMCAPSDIIPKDILCSLYRLISSPQTLVRKKNAKRCGECKTEFDQLLPCPTEGANKDYSYIMSLLGIEVDVVNCTETDRSGALNNCGHCGRFLCRKCLSHSLLKELMPVYLTSPSKGSSSPGGMRFSFGSNTSDCTDSTPLCGICHDILLK
jgi:ankyrin repeat protein